MSQKSFYYFVIWLIKCNDLILMKKPIIIFLQKDIAESTMSAQNIKTNAYFDAFCLTCS